MPLLTIELDWVLLTKLYQQIHIILQWSCIYIILYNIYAQMNGLDIKFQIDRNLLRLCLCQLRGFIYIRRPISLPTY
jgi:hypothetical protein